MRSSFYRNGRIWSREGIRLIAALTTSGASEASLASQPHPASPAVVSVVSASDADGKASARHIVGTIEDGPPVATNILRLSVDDGVTPVHYDYTLLGTEGGASDVYGGLAAVVEAANGGAGDPHFTVANGTTELDIDAKVTGTVPNAITVTLVWVGGTATAHLVNTDGANATGVRTVRVDYLDATGHEKSETLTLNGTDAVETVHTAIWVQRLTAKTAGSGNDAAGDITASIGGDAFVTIKAGGVQSQTGGYMVPTAKQLRLACLTGGCESPVRVRVRTTHDGETGITFADLKHVACDFIAGPNAEDFDFCDGSPSYPAGTVLAVTVAVNSKLVVATLLGYLEPEGTIG